MSLLAAYHSYCNECALDIEPGDLITGALDGYVHLDCADEDDFTEQPTRLCSDCFLTAPCFCDGDL